MIYSFSPKNVTDTVLFKRLMGPFNEKRYDDLASQLMPVIVDVCGMAYQHMKGMEKLHPEFTLHDEVHLLRVTELMGRLIPSNVLKDVLNPVEIALLILSAHLHDVGMVPDFEEYSGMVSTIEYKQERNRVLIENAGIGVALEMVASGVDDGHCKQIAAEFEQAAFTMYVRNNHAKMSKSFVDKKLNDEVRLRVGTGHLAKSLGLLCLSHNMPYGEISEKNGFYADKAIGDVPVNMIYLASVLRLADLLDFDRERTPDDLFNNINFSNPISLQEWEKHRQVEGWHIAPGVIRFECSCKRPEYEQTIRKFHDYIDYELNGVRFLLKEVEGNSLYKLELPHKTDRSRIGPEADSYIYVSDLNVTLARDEIIKLLMTTNLYHSESLAIRELLQNSLDALRHRKALIKRDDLMDWGGGSVKFTHEILPSGEEFLHCVDDGVGMDVDIIKNYLLNAGRSYYRSFEFNNDRLTFLKANADFDPCAKFGIGFMSLFMLGDRIEIKTRMSRKSRCVGDGCPLIVEINGTGGIVFVKKGECGQPVGTAIRVSLKKELWRQNNYMDKFNLIETLTRYAVACEFDVIAEVVVCGVSLASHVISKGVDAMRFVNRLAVSQGYELSIDFNSVDKNLNGSIRAMIPLDSNGMLALNNSEFGWHEIVQPLMGGWPKIVGNNEKVQGRSVGFLIGKSNFEKKKIISVDGILVAGGVLRDEVFSSNLLDIPFGSYSIDVRGELKPELSPDRYPPQVLTRSNPEVGYYKMLETPKWDNLFSYVNKAYALMLDGFLLKFNKIENRNFIVLILSAFVFKRGLLGNKEFRLIGDALLWREVFLPEDVCSKLNLPGQVHGIKNLILNLKQDLCVEFSVKDVDKENLFFMNSLGVINAIVMEIGVVDYIDRKVVVSISDVGLNRNFGPCRSRYFGLVFRLNWIMNFSGVFGDVLFIVMADGWKLFNQNHWIVSHYDFYSFDFNKCARKLPDDWHLFWYICSAVDDGFLSILRAYMNDELIVALPESFYRFDELLRCRDAYLKGNSSLLKIYSLKHGFVEFDSSLFYAKFSPEPKFSN